MLTIENFSLKQLGIANTMFGWQTNGVNTSTDKLDMFGKMSNLKTQFWKEELN